MYEVTSVIKGEDGKKYKIVSVVDFESKEEAEVFVMDLLRRGYAGTSVEILSSVVSSVRLTYRKIGVEII